MAVKVVKKDAAGEPSSWPVQCDILSEPPRSRVILAHLWALPAWHPSAGNDTVFRQTPGFSTEMGLRLP
jgi:hypothetical protein